MITGFLPFITLLVYIIFLSESKIVNKTVIEQVDRAKVVIKLIDNHLNALSKEIKFLSSLDIMDDILAEDIDKRISRLLTQKSNDLNLDVTFIVIDFDLNGTVVASSDNEYLSKKYDLAKLKSHQGNYIEDKYLYIYSKITASFDEKKELGYLMLKYNLDNLGIYLTYKDRVHSYIVNANDNITIGEKFS
jgi:hypothetical protein